ncbi:hypothetical protein ACFOGI_14650 [Virgibacillus xinjiangensis]|uniref:Uncharacterized protein n=1 Tax=Virgibacillus xinjiangensis TaxID=393090 RepID=A0ABV7CZB0_9BACI
MFTVRSEAPAPMVTAGTNEEIPTAKGPYCWNGSLFQCIDKPLDRTKAHEPTVVSPNEEIMIDYEKEPMVQKLRVDKRIGENRQENIRQIERNHDSIVVPEEKGIYVYHVLAYWEKGDRNYTFSVKVE